ncbi:hypothetical protein S245_001682 [Arachis hypogaea]
MAESLTCSPVSTLLQPSAPAPPQSSAFLRAPPLGLRNPLTYEHRGIVFLIIDSTESVIDIVSFFRFPPIGIHGLAHSVVQASGYDIDEGYLGSYQEEMLIMFQVESVEGVKNVGEILAVDGIDFIQMGSLDLSASMRYLWDPGNRNVRQLMREAEANILKRHSGGGFGMGTYLSGFAMLHDRSRDLNSQVTWVSHGV